MTAADLAARLRAKGKPIRPSGKWFNTLCPAHGDTNPSLDFKDGQRRIVLKCFARHCERRKILAAFGLSETDVLLSNGHHGGSAPPEETPPTTGAGTKEGADGDRPPTADEPARSTPLTLAELAAAKGLPVEFLVKIFGLHENPGGVFIRYRLTDGTVAPRHKQRVALTGENRFRWTGRPQDPLHAYGLWTLRLAQKTGNLLLVEGESDVWTAGLYQFLAYGIPGVNMPHVLQAEDLVGIPEVYILQENDDAGETFVQGLAQRLAEIRYRGQARIFRMPDGLKDLNDLHRDDPSRFVDRFQAAIQAAVPLELRPVFPAEPVDLKELTPKVLDAVKTWNTPMIGSPRIYNSAGIPARLDWTPAGESSLTPIEREHVLWLLAHVALWDRPSKTRGKREGEKEEEKARPRAPAIPPRHVIDVIRAQPATIWPHLHRFVSAPFFRPDGTLVLAPGYDAVTGLYYVEQPGLVVPPVSETPSPAEITEARDLIITETLGDFCFWDKAADRANAVSMMVTPFLQPFYEGHTPLGAISKSVHRAGGGLLLDTLLWPALGRRLPRTSLPESSEEVRKTLFAFAREGQQAILFDNLNGALDQNPIAAYLTSDSIRDRVLGISGTATAAALPLIYVTGIGVTYSSEMTGRVCLTELRPQVEHPEERTDFKHPDLRRFVRAERGRLIWAICTLIRATIAAGWPRPTKSPILGDFQGWTDTVASILGVAGVPGFLENRDQLRGQDPVGEGWRLLVQRWAKQFGTKPVTAGMLWPLTGWKPKEWGHTPSLGDPAAPEPLGYPDVPLPLGLREGSEKSMATSFGMQLAKRARGQIFGEWQIQYINDDHNARIYHLVPAPPARKGDEGGETGTGGGSGD
jgi:hypothetical protein